MEIITSFTALNLEPGNLPKEASQLRQGDFQVYLCMRTQKDLKSEYALSGAKS